MDNDKIENKTTLGAKVVKNIKTDIKSILKLLAVGLVLWAGVIVLMTFLPNIATQLPLPVYDFFDSIMVFTTDSPYSLATLGISIVCFSIILFLILYNYFFPKPPC